MVNQELEPGDNISADLDRLLGFYALNSSSYSTSYYYIIPLEGKYYSLRITSDLYNNAKQLSDETSKFLTDHTQPPSSLLHIDGTVSKLSNQDDEILTSYKEALIELGLTDSEIKAIGEPLVIITQNFVTGIYFFIGGIFFIILYMI